MTDELYQKYIDAVKLIYVCIRQPFLNCRLQTKWIAIFLDDDERWRLESWLEDGQGLIFDIEVYPTEPVEKTHYTTAITLRDRDGEVYIEMEDTELVPVCVANIWKALFLGYFNFKL